MLYQEAIIDPSYSGFGEWVCNMFEPGEPWDLYAWIAEVEGQGMECFILGKDELPKDIEDIRGHILSEPPIVVAVKSREDGRVWYRGLVPA
jgi:hypothetical protein